MLLEGDPKIGPVRVAISFCLNMITVGYSRAGPVIVAIPWNL